MRNYIYKIIIFTFSAIIIYKFTIGEQINKVTDRINMFASKDGRKQIVNSIKKEIKKANEKENYFNNEERELIKKFILKISKELNLQVK